MDDDLEEERTELIKQIQRLAVYMEKNFTFINIIELIQIWDGA